jgi:hypothetical protein
MNFRRNWSNSPIRDGTQRVSWSGHIHEALTPGAGTSARKLLVISRDTGIDGLHCIGHANSC